MNARQPQRKTPPNTVVRPLVAADIDAIIEIDANVMGEAKPEYWRRKLAVYVSRPVSVTRDSGLSVVSSPLSVVKGKDSIQRTTDHGPWTTDEFHESRITNHEPQPLARVAEVNGRVVGFMIGEIRSWEFRQPPTGWITALAIDPNVRRQGIARRLLAEVLDYFRERGLENVRTMVAWADGEVLSFFTAMGFDRGPFIELEKKLSL